MIVVDTSIIVAYMNAADELHATAADWLDGAEDDLITTPLIIAEVDHLVGARGGPTARQALHLWQPARWAGSRSNLGTLTDPRPQIRP